MARNRRSRWSIARTVLLTIVTGALIAGLSLASPMQEARAALAQPAESTCVQSCTGVPSTGQAAAQSLLSSYNSGTLIIEWAERDIIPAELQPIANGTIGKTPQCNIDTRTLQTLVIIIRNYGSVQVSDLNRHCANDGVATCASNPTSRHCVPSSGPNAMDITYIGGARTRGNDSASSILLRFLDSFLPNGSRAGQASGGDNCGVYSMPGLANISRFTDYCTHIHIDLGSTTAGLRNLR
ncbi:hypothetical protein LLS1_28650 [Leifsonia sp. LS1]|uniref:hypothetical protein n=1 Tax=Leifsonia sp. LS1 TaxID=2828483 RepID=UPI001CFE8D98|nr:hypothetical protein [Leifsonia sp. LS1]GIT81196.1 hypothetical protein LLS1_28650 [Leifsonia sp. LS1]